MMPTDAQRDAVKRFNDEATAALMAWQAAHWELSIEGKAAFLSGYVAATEKNETRELPNNSGCGWAPHEADRR